MPIKKRRKTKLSEVVVGKQRHAVDIAKSASSNAPAVAEDLEPFLLRGLPEGQSLPDVELFLIILGNIVQHDSEVMEAADETHFDALSLFNRLGLKRDAFTRRLVPTLTDIRDIFDTAFGTDSCQRILGLGVELPTDALRVRRLTARVVRLLTSEDFELPPAVSDVAGVDVDKWVQQLTPDLGGLRAIMDRISDAKREAERTVAAKTEAVETYNQSFLRCSQLLEVFFKVSGNEYLAERLRPKTPKSRSEQPSEAGAAAAGAPAAGAPADGDDSGEPSPQPAVAGDGETDSAGDGAQPSARPDRPPAEPAAERPAEPPAITFQQAEQRPLSSVELSR